MACDGRRKQQARAVTRMDVPVAAWQQWLSCCTAYAICWAAATGAYAAQPALLRCRLVAQTGHGAVQAPHSNCCLLAVEAPTLHWWSTGGCFGEERLRSQLLDSLV